MNYALMNLLADAAQTTATTDAAAATEMSAGATFIAYAVQLVPMILIFVVFYFVLIRPQRKKDKEAKAMPSAIYSTPTHAPRSAPPLSPARMAVVTPARMDTNLTT